MQMILFANIRKKVFKKFFLHCMTLPAVINLALSFEGEELPLFRHFRRTRTIDTINLVKHFQNCITDTQSCLLNTIFAQRLFCNKAYQNLYFMAI